MDTSLYVNLSRQTAVMRELEIVANNLANVNTTGFRAERTLFDAALKKAGSSDTVSFVIDRATYTDHRAGGLVQTDNPLDIALRGEGFLSVQTQDGVRYTRDGRLVVSPAGELSALDGAPILDRGGSPIPIPPDADHLLIAQDGTVSVDGTDLGQIGIFEFDDPQNLVREADGRFDARTEPEPAIATSVRQGSIEASNVDPIREITRLIELSRAYEQSAKMASDIHNQKKDAVKRLGSQS
jgi:flagellar basal-body rod protein FlgF